MKFDIQKIDKKEKKDASVHKACICGGKAYDDFENCYFFTRRGVRYRRYICKCGLSREDIIGFDHRKGICGYGRL